MSWRCATCDGAKGGPIIVAYMCVRVRVRRLFSVCSVCDSVSLWPNYERTKPPVQKE